MDRHIFVVFTNPAEGREADFNRWYDETHLSQVLAVPGFVRASRHRVAQAGDEPLAHRYLALYEIEADDPQAVLKELQRRVEAGEIEMSDALAPDVKANLVQELTRQDA